jgi:hypothetical protein
MSTVLDLAWQAADSEAVALKGAQLEKKWIKDLFYQVVTRVTRWVGEKISLNVAQLLFVKLKTYKTYTVDTSIPTTWATYLCNFQTTAQGKQ